MKEKKYNIILFLLLFVTILSTILIRPVQDMDEIWNYNFARNIANGLLPYKDFNIIVTPLLSIICGVILKITFNELIVMRFLAAILGASVLYLIYKIFNILNIKKEIATLYTFLIFALLRNYFFIDYNFAVILIGLIIIFWELKLYKKDDIFYKVNKNYEILLGILGGISITLKQTSGLLICIALLANKIIFIRRKEEFKIYLKSFCYRLIGILIPTTAFIIYLLYNGIFNDFINYTILGILEFTNKVPYTKLIKFNLVGILRIIVPITMIYSWIKTIILEKDKNEYFLLIYGIATFASICFPISNSIHFTISSLPIFIIILYELYKIILILYKKNEKVWSIIFKRLRDLAILIMLGYSIINFYNYYKKAESYSELNHFSYIPIEYGLQEEIKKISNYIKENKDVKMLYYSAAIYNIPLDIYNKDLDMFNTGNFGYKGNDRIKKEILNSKDVKYLILKDIYYNNWQTPYDIIEFTKNNKILEGEIGPFNIYK